jgi:hypothetical protein
MPGAQGTIFSETQLETAAECCMACSKRPLCAGWSYKACRGGFDKVAAKTCHLKSLWYPALQVLSFHLSAEAHKLWVSGLKRQPAEGVSPATCQPAPGVCGAHWQRCEGLAATFTCASEELCGTMGQARLWYKAGGEVQGTVLTLDQNSYVPGASAACSLPFIKAHSSSWSICH